MSFKAPLSEVIPLHYTAVHDIYYGRLDMILRHLLFLILIWSNNLHAQELMKVIAIEYPPFLTSQSKTFGSNFVMLKQYANTHFKIGYEPYFIPPGRAQHLIDQGKWCISFYPPRKQNKKAKFVLLSPETVKLGLYRLKQHNEFNYNSLSELHGSVAILRSNNLGAIPKTLEDAGLELVHLEKIEQGIHMLLAGRVDYAFGDTTTIKTYAEIPNIDQLQFSEVPLQETQDGFFYNIDCEESLYKSRP